MELWNININSRSFFHHCQVCKKTPLEIVVLNNSYWSYSTLVSSSIEPPSSVLETPSRDVPEKLLAKCQPHRTLLWRWRNPHLFVWKPCFNGQVPYNHSYNIIQYHTSFLSLQEKEVQVELHAAEFARHISPHWGLELGDRGCWESWMRISSFGSWWKIATYNHMINVPWSKNVQNMKQLTSIDHVHLQ